VPRKHNEINFFLFSFVVLLLKLNNWKGKKRETLLLFLKVLILVYERERGSRRPSHSKSSDRSHSLHDPILIYLSWAKCPPKTIGSWNPSPPQLLPFLELLYYITFSINLSVTQNFVFFTHSSRGTRVDMAICSWMQKW
jgi:hypothetical protein